MIEAKNAPVPDFSEIEPLKNDAVFKSLMEQAIELASDIKILTDQYQEVREELNAHLTELKVTGSVTFNKWRLSVIDSEGRQKLNMKKLLRLLGPHGPTLVKQATDKGNPIHYVQLTPPGKETKDDE
jgi:hypothetical protein